MPAQNVYFSNAPSPQKQANNSWIIIIGVWKGFN